VNVSGHGNAHPLTQTALHNLLADHNNSFTAEFRVHNWVMGETCRGPILLQKLNQAILMVCTVHFNDDPTVPPNKTTNTTLKDKNELKHKEEMKNYENNQS